MTNTRTWIRIRCVLVGLAMCTGALDLVTADCTMTDTGKTPLCDLVGEYRGFRGGLYPDGTSIRPATHEATGIDRAQNQVRPLNSQGAPDASNGRIVFMSLGMSNTEQEFDAYLNLIRNDTALNPKLTVVNGAVAGYTAEQWLQVTSPGYVYAANQLSLAHVTAAQVQVMWVKVVMAGFGTNTDDPLANFPSFQQSLQTALGMIARNLKTLYPNIKIAFFSSRIRAYSGPKGLSPEPTAYESAFAVRWAIEDQLRGVNNLNLSVAPWMSWGPYLWADGLVPRSDGLTYPCDDLERDFVHPGPGAETKVAQQLQAFLMTDPTATPWYLKPASNPPLVNSLTATPPGGAPGVRIQFNASASDPQGIRDYIWTFGDGTSAYGSNPSKLFHVAGRYPVRLTVLDQDGNATTRLMTIPIGAGNDGPSAPRNLRVVPQEVSLRHPAAHGSVHTR